MEHLESPSAEAHALPSVTIRVPALDPAAVLSRASTYPRGFWARGDRWVIHSGSVAEFHGRAGSADRFEAVWAEAAPLFRRYEELRAPDDEAGKPPRVYGGFSFRDDSPVHLNPPARPNPAGDPHWTHFPAAHFVLPTYEVVGKGEFSLITVRAEGGRSEEELLDEARSLSEALVSEGSEAPASDGLERSHPHTVDQPAHATIRAEPREGDAEDWRIAVEEALAWIERGRISKVVLARTLDLPARDGVPADRVVLNLWRQNPGTHVFLFEPTKGHLMVGAAPETVATASGGVFKATAVAGSISRGHAPEDQEALALKLVESEKDRVEHSIAVNDMVERLRPHTEELGWDSEPHVLTLSGIQHLETRIQARLRAGRSVLSVLGALHPTAAVCGLPRDAAMDFLRVEERFDRGWYAGPVGWFNAAGDGVFAPAIRSGIRAGDHWRLFAGAGIVEGSEPDLEWEETRIKFEPVLRAIVGAEG